MGVHLNRWGLVSRFIKNSKKKKQVNLGVKPPGPGWMSLGAVRAKCQLGPDRPKAEGSLPTAVNLEVRGTFRSRVQAMVLTVFAFLCYEPNLRIPRSLRNHQRTP